jgi:hypothetical protein
LKCAHVFQYIRRKVWDWLPISQAKGYEDL